MREIKGMLLTHTSLQKAIFMHISKTLSYVETAKNVNVKKLK